MGKIIEMLKKRTTEELVNDLLETISRNEPEMQKIRELIINELSSR